MDTTNRHSSYDQNQKNCKVCGRVFSHPYSLLCPECMKRDEEDFQKVRTFLKEFPGSKITTVEEYTGVSRKKIMRYLKEERIELAPDSADLLKCARCGAPITKGMYCAKCYSNFKKEVNQIFAKPETETETAKMHIQINRDKK